MKKNTTHHATVTAMFALLGLMFLALPANAQDAFSNAQDEIGKTGSYRIRLEGLPYHIYYDTRLRYGWSPRADDRDQYQNEPNAPYTYRNRDDERWDVTVPETYRADRPAGLIVFIRPGGSATPSESWNEALTKHNLLWVSISAGGTVFPHYFAHTKAVHAVTLMRERYAIDTRRIYIVGKDHGAHVANAAAVLTPETFRAAFMLFGGGFPGDIEVREFTEPGMAPEANRRLLRQAAENSQLVYLNGEAGVSRETALLAAWSYERSGFRHVTIFDETELGTEMPDAEWLVKAIDIFESPMHREAEQNYERAVRALARDRKAQALPLFLDALSVGSTAEFAEDAQAKLTELLDAYAAEMGIIEAHIAASELDDLRPLLSAFKRNWGAHGEADSERLEEAYKQATRDARQRDREERSNP